MLKEEDNEIQQQNFNNSGEFLSPSCDIDKNQLGQKGEVSREASRKKEDLFLKSHSKDKYDREGFGSRRGGEKSKDKKNLKKKYLASVYSLGLKKKNQETKQGAKALAGTAAGKKPASGLEKKNSDTIEIKNLENTAGNIFTNASGVRGQGQGNPSLATSTNFKKTKSLERKNKKTDYRNLYNYISNNPKLLNEQNQKIFIDKTTKQDQVSPAQPAQ